MRLACAALLAIAGGAALTAALSALGRHAVPARGRIDRTSDGRACRVIAEGPPAPAAPVAVLIHGLGGQPENFARVIPLLLAEGWRVLAPDRAGAGRSDPAPPGGAALPAQAARIAALIEAEAAAPAIIVGHSLGGAVALQLAADRPDLVRGVVLVGALTRPERTRMARLTVALNRAAPLREGLTQVLTGPGMLATGTLVKWFSFAPERMPPGFMRWGGGWLAAQPRAISGVMRDLEVLAFGIGALRPRFSGLRMPVTVLHGARDKVLPAARHALPLAGAVPQARIEIIAGAGHMLPVTQPGLVVAAITALR